ncbi:hypothetical protein TNCV_119041 [Trichonephila clavipes]|nr:hypothetical protein TNCV_119041 [Trichonephila clavipes]
MDCDPWEGFLGQLYLCFLDDTEEEIVLFIPCVGSGVGLFWSPCSDPCRDNLLYILDRFLSVRSTDPLDATLRFNLGSSHPAFPLFVLRPLISSLEVFVDILDFPVCELLDPLLDLCPSYSVST